MSAGGETKPPPLLLIGCSCRKVADLRRGRAWDIDDGPLFQVLKKTLRGQVGWEAGVEVLIVSAKYGVIRADRVIRTDDERLTAAAARERAARFGRQLQGLVAGRRFRAVHVNLGRHYFGGAPGPRRFVRPGAHRAGLGRHRDAECPDAALAPGATRHGEPRA